MNLFAFASRKNLLHQLLDGVVVHRVGVDVPTELVKVPSLLTKTQAELSLKKGWRCLCMRKKSTTVSPQGPERGDNVPVLHLSLLSRSLERSFQSSAQTFGINDCKSCDLKLPET